MCRHYRQVGKGGEKKQGSFGSEFIPDRFRCCFFRGELVTGCGKRRRPPLYPWAGSVSLADWLRRRGSLGCVYTCNLCKMSFCLKYAHFSGCLGPYYVSCSFVGRLLRCNVQGLSDLARLLV